MSKVTINDIDIELYKYIKDSNFNTFLDLYTKIPKKFRYKYIDGKLINYKFESNDILVDKNYPFEDNGDNYLNFNYNTYIPILIFWYIINKDKLKNNDIYFQSVPQWSNNTEEIKIDLEENDTEIQILKRRILLKLTDIELSKEQKNIDIQTNDKIKEIKSKIDSKVSYSNNIKQDIKSSIIFVDYFESDKNILDKIFNELPLEVKYQNKKFKLLYISYDLYIKFNNDSIPKIDDNPKNRIYNILNDKSLYSYCNDNIDFYEYSKIISEDRKLKDKTISSKYDKINKIIKKNYFNYFPKKLRLDHTNDNEFQNNPFIKFRLNNLNFYISYIVDFKKEAKGESKNIFKYYLTYESDNKGSIKDINKISSDLEDVNIFIQYIYKFLKIYQPLENSKYIYKKYIIPELYIDCTIFRHMIMNDKYISDKGFSNFEPSISNTITKKKYQGDNPFTVSKGDSGASEEIINNFNLISILYKENNRSFKITYNLENKLTKYTKTIIRSNISNELEYIDNGLSIKIEYCDENNINNIINKALFCINYYYVYVKETNILNEYSKFCNEYLNKGEYEILFDKKKIFSDISETKQIDNSFELIQTLELLEKGYEEKSQENIIKNLKEILNVKGKVEFFEKDIFFDKDDKSKSSYTRTCDSKSQPLQLNKKELLTLIQSDYLRKLYINDNSSVEDIKNILYNYEKIKNVDEDTKEKSKYLVDIFNLFNEKQRILPFPLLSKLYETKYYICTDKKLKYIRVIMNKSTNFINFPWVPCCYTILDKNDTNLSYYYKNLIGDIKQKKISMYIDAAIRGGLSRKMSERFNIKSESYIMRDNISYQYKGTIDSLSSNIYNILTNIYLIDNKFNKQTIITSILKSLNTKFKYSEILKDENEIKDDILKNYSNMFYLCLNKKNTDLNKLKSEFDKDFICPIKFKLLLEHYFKINIILIENNKFTIYENYTNSSEYPIELLENRKDIVLIYNPNNIYIKHYYNLIYLLNENNKKENKFLKKISYNDNPDIYNKIISDYYENIKYKRILSDYSGNQDMVDNISIDYGVYNIPESFINSIEKVYLSSNYKIIKIEISLLNRNRFVINTIPLPIFDMGPCKYENMTISRINKTRYIKKDSDVVNNFIKNYKDNSIEKVKRYDIDNDPINKWMLSLLDKKLNLSKAISVDKKIAQISDDIVLKKDSTSTFNRYKVEYMSKILLEYTYFKFSKEFSSNIFINKLDEFFSNYTEVNDGYIYSEDIFKTPINLEVSWLKGYLENKNKIVYSSSLLINQIKHLLKIELSYNYMKIVNYKDCKLLRNIYNLSVYMTNNINYKVINKHLLKYYIELYNKKLEYFDKDNIDVISKKSIDLNNINSYEKNNKGKSNLKGLNKNLMTDIKKYLSGDKLSRFGFLRLLYIIDAIKNNIYYYYSSDIKKIYKCNSFSFGSKDVDIPGDLSKSYSLYNIIILTIGLKLCEIKNNFTKGMLGDIFDWKNINIYKFIRRIIVYKNGILYKSEDFNSDSKSRIKFNIIYHIPNKILQILF